MPTPIPPSAPGLRVLLCWGYGRRGWTRPFEELGADIAVEFLFHVHAAEEQVVATSAPRHFWADFRDAHEVLDRIAPDRVIFMSLTGLWSITLNHAARQRGIPTFVMQHGVMEHAEAHLTAQGAGSWSAVVAASAGATAAPRFALRTYSWRRRHHLLRPLLMMTASRRYGIEPAARRHHFRDRFPDWYVCFSRRDALHYLTVDRAPQSRVTAIGPPEYDLVFRALADPAPASEAAFLLVIDTPNAANQWGATAVTPAEKADFFSRVAEAAAALGLPVVVKLHPESFADDWLPAPPNLTYARDVDITDLLPAARLVIGFDSSLLVPVLPLRPTLLVRLYPHPLPDRAQEVGAAVVVDSLPEVDADALRAAQEAFTHNDDGRNALLAEFAEHTDGRATERLRAVLLDPSTYYARHSLAATAAHADAR